MKSMSTPFTRACYDRLPEGFPAQLVDGLLIHDPAPLRGHQALVGDLFLAIAPLVGSRRVFVSPIDVPLDDLNVLQPDLAIWATPPPLDRPEADLPSVVIEVLSPSNRRLDRTVKAAKYLQAGILEVWLVDPERKTVEIRTRDQSSACHGEEPACSEVVEGLVIVPATLFAGL